MIPEMRSSAHFRSCTGGVGSVATKFATGRLVSTATHDEAALPERRRAPQGRFFFGGQVQTWQRPRNTGLPGRLVQPLAGVAAKHSCPQPLPKGTLL